MSQYPSIRNLEYLLALKRHLHFAKAAKSCFVSQSTLSVGIKILECDLNVQLAERTNKSVLLNPLGEKVAQQAEIVLCAMKNLIKATNVDFFRI